MTWTEATLLLGTSLLAAILGAWLGAFLQRRHARARPVVFIKNCELSSRLLTRVDYLTMPDAIAAKHSAFRWSLPHEKEFVPSDTTILPLGLAQEELMLLQALLPQLDAAVQKSQRIAATFQGATPQQRKDMVGDFLREQTIVRALMGKILRSSFSVFASSAAIDFNQPTQLTWTVDQASGPGKGTLGRFGIQLGSARVSFPFQWPDEEDRMKLISFLIARCDPDAFPKIANEIADELRQDQQSASDLQTWFEANNDLNATLNLSVAISNLGGQPLLASGRSTVVVPLPDRTPLQIECQSEAYSGDTESDAGTKRMIAALKSISQAVDRAIPIRSSVPTEKIMVEAGKSETLTFRSLQSFRELPSGPQLLHLFRCREVNAHLVLRYQTDEGKTIAVESAKFTFGSSTA